MTHLLLILGKGMQKQLQQNIKVYTVTVGFFLAGAVHKGSLRCTHDVDAYTLQVPLMSNKARDFYHIQDELNLAWRYLTPSQASSSIELDALTTEIESISKSLESCSPEVEKFIDLTHQKILLLEAALQSVVVRKDEVRDLIELVKRRVEVSLSSSGMGFFSQESIDEDAVIEIVLHLDTVDKELNLEASVLESRVSADSENPGFWIRTRFTRKQDQKIDLLLAHVSQRQIEKLERKSKVIATI